MQLATMPLPAEGKQWQRQSLGRQHADVHADVDEGLYADPHANSLRNKSRKRTLQIRRLAPDGVSAIKQPDEQRDDQRTPANPSSSATTASRKVRVCASGKYCKLFNRRPQPNPEPFTAAERNQRMR